MKRVRLKKGARRQIYHEDYLQSGHWRKTRAEAIARAGGRCQICGKTGPLEVHHLTYARLFNEAPEDLLVLCDECHAQQHGIKEESDMLDMNTIKTGPYFIELIDRGVIRKRNGEPQRDYLGASLLGETCGRKLQYEFFHTEPDEPLTARTLRIFERGHKMEEMMAEWIYCAGFFLRDCQAGFSQLGGKIQGHIDGIFASGPEECGPYPRLWENKALGCKTFRKIAREGLKKAEPRYFGQIQLYMAYLELDENPALFTAVNADDMEILALDVEFDQEEAQRLSDRAVRIIEACEAGRQLERCAKDPSWFECKMCKWRKRCWI